jgi:hypothetical protein
MRTYREILLILLCLVAVFHPTSENKVTVEADCNNPIQEMQAETLYAFCLERKVGDDAKCQEDAAKMACDPDILYQKCYYAGVIPVHCTKKQLCQGKQGEPIDCEEVRLIYNNEREDMLQDYLDYIEKTEEGNI